MRSAIACSSLDCTVAAMGHRKDQDSLDTLAPAPVQRASCLLLEVQEAEAEEVEEAAICFFPLSALHDAFKDLPVTG